MDSIWYSLPELVMIFPSLPWLKMTKIIISAFLCCGSAAKLTSSYKFDVEFYYSCANINIILMIFKSVTVVSKEKYGFSIHTWCSSWYFRFKQTLTLKCNWVRRFSRFSRSTCNYLNIYYMEDIEARYFATLIEFQRIYDRHTFEPIRLSCISLS